MAHAGVRNSAKGTCVPGARGRRPNFYRIHHCAAGECTRFRVCVGCVWMRCTVASRTSGADGLWRSTPAPGRTWIQAAKGVNVTIPQLDGRQLKLCTKGKVCFAAQQLQRNSPCSACITRCNSSAQGRIVSGRDSTCHSVPVPCHPCGRSDSERRSAQTRSRRFDSIIAASACRRHSSVCSLADLHRTARPYRLGTASHRRAGRQIRRCAADQRRRCPPSARTENAQPSCDHRWSPAEYTSSANQLAAAPSSADRCAEQRSKRRPMSVVVQACRSSTRSARAIWSCGLSSEQSTGALKLKLWLHSAKTESAQLSVSNVSAAELS
jgi:hypothetical protein